MKQKRRSRAFKENNKVINIEKAREERKAKRRQLAEKKKKKERPAPVSPRRATKKIRRRLICTGLVLLMALGVVSTLIGFRALKADQAEAAAARDALLEEKARLEEELLLVDTPEYIEQQARTHLRMVKPGELLYILRQDEEQGNSEVMIESAQE